VNRLKAYRALKNLSQAEVAKALGIAKSTYCNKELGNRKFTLGEVEKLSELLGYSVEEIFFKKDVLK